MNKQEFDILHFLANQKYTTQRELSNACGYSLGVVNKSLQKLMAGNYLSSDNKLTEKAREEIHRKSPRRAILLAAGFGMRMVPINMETPKALVTVNGEPLIERLIKQLHEVGVTEIYVVVGFMKERFEYLIDEYGVELIINPDYSAKNNLHSLKLAAPKIQNAYIVPCDLWCAVNPFRSSELYSWYMVSEHLDQDSAVRVNRKMELVAVPELSNGNTMIGISYLVGAKAEEVQKKIAKLCENPNYDGAFWESSLYETDRMIIPARVVSSADVTEINTYEQLRELDSQSNHLKSEAISIIAQALGVEVDEIVGITVLKKGMTNRSFLFSCRNKKYIMRIPGEGTDRLINRREEASVYHAIDGRHLCDEIIYINPVNGYKITEFLENARNCDAENANDLAACMKKLRDFHQLGLQVDHEFEIFKQIEFYEGLWGDQPSVFRDYQKTKACVFQLQEYIERHAETKVLTHIDAVPDNFLFIKNENGDEEIRIIDWEYAGMQDPHVDIAMFCIYSLYDRQQVDHLIDTYFTEGCPHETRMKIYCYIASCGLLWSNWCEYKRHLGVEFGEYSIRQYRYAKEYYRIVQNEINKTECACTEE